MDRARLIGSLVVACLLGGAGVAMAQTPPNLTPPTPLPPLSATLETCQTSALPAQRVASFVGSMPAITGAVRMQMRFDLKRRHPDERLWRDVRGAQGFGVWETAMPDRAGFVFHKRVDSLQVPAAYRAIVRFRWYAADGTLVRQARLRTPACNQPDLRPDLVPGALTAVADLQPLLADYTLVVRNDGRSDAGPFSVRVGSGVSEVGGLAAGAQVSVAVLAVACMPGSSVRVVVDADQRVDESDERNALRRACPLPG